MEKLCAPGYTRVAQIDYSTLCLSACLHQRVAHNCRIHMQSTRHSEGMLHAKGQENRTQEVLELFGCLWMRQMWQMLQDGSNVGNSGIEWQQ